MASGYKSHKTELVAIYRLEFYRKQKNWKFAHETKKSVKTPRSKYTELRKSLNETYDIETEANNECSPLNHGFLDDVPDKLPESSKQSPTPGESPEEELQHDLPWHADQQCLKPERDVQPWWDVEQEALCEPCWSEPVAPSPTPEVEPWAASYDCVDTPQDCVDAPRGCLEDMHLEELVSAIQKCESLGNLSGQCLEPPVCACAHRDASSDSLVEFIRGAHLAPHSSEVDLNLDTPGGACAACETCETCAACAACEACAAARLPQRALARAVRAHARRLHALLHEARRRDRHQLSRTCWSEQLVPREPAALPRSQRVARQDTFTLSAEGGRGRGRGRLHRDHLINMGMDGPFRFT